MKIVHVSTGYLKGGAGIACKRMHESLLEKKMDSNVLTLENLKGTYVGVNSLSESIFMRIWNICLLLLDKLFFLPFEKDRTERFLFSLGRFGRKISLNQLISNADVVHFHWVQNGFVSLSQFKKVIALDKKIVLTMHDSWLFTAGCQVTKDCVNYENTCVECPFFKKNKLIDKILLSNQKIKNQIFDNPRIHFLAPSHNHMLKAKRSRILKNADVRVMPNMINMPLLNENREKLKSELGISLDKKIILFGVVNANHNFKGLKLLLTVLLDAIFIDCQIITFGREIDDFDSVGRDIINMGYIHDMKLLSKLYKVSDVFVSPSSEESFGQTLVESLNNGTPVVGFDKTGASDIIDHLSNGYLAKNKDVKDLKEGILWCLNQERDLLKVKIENSTNKFKPENVVVELINYYSFL